MPEFKREQVALMNVYSSADNGLGEIMGVMCGSMGGIGAKAAMPTTGNVLGVSDVLRVGASAEGPDEMPHWQVVNKFMKWTKRECTCLKVALASSSSRNNREDNCRILYNRVWNLKNVTN